MVTTLESSNVRRRDDTKTVSETARGKGETILPCSDVVRLAVLARGERAHMHSACTRRPGQLVDSGQRTTLLAKTCTVSYERKLQGCLIVNRWFCLFWKTLFNYL